MNKISPKRPMPPKDDKVEDAFVTEEQRQEYYDQVRLEEKREKRRAQRKALFNTLSVVGLVTVVGIEGISIIAMLPLQKVIPIVVYQRENGTVVSTIEWKDLPREVQEDTTVNVVWQYVQHRESWSWGNAPLAYDVVSAMSSPNVRKQFQENYDGKNPLSPQRLYGDTNVQIKYVNWTAVCPESGCLGPPSTYRFWFDRTEVSPGGKPSPPVTYAVTVRIQRNVPLPTDRAGWRWTFNAPLIQVIDYPGAQRESIAR